MSEIIKTAVVAIITCNRPAGLDKLLSALTQLELPNFPNLKLQIVVVENGQKLEAENQVEQYRARGLNILYANEPTPGISYARNCAMKLAVATGEYFAFIDDDEYPEPLWLDSLLSCARDYGVPIVRGPVLPVFEANAASWVQAGGFFSRERFATGTEMTYCASNNVLIQSELILDSGHEFDSRFALTGGEDTLFFLQLRKLTAARIIWCDTAIVHEDVAASRATITWLKRRAAREGANMPQYDAVLGDARFFRVRWILQGTAHCVLSIPMWLVGCFQGEIVRMRSQQKFALGLGMIRGSFGHEVNEYGERHNV